MDELEGLRLELKAVTQSRDELLAILRELVVREGDAIFVNYGYDINLIDGLPDLDKWIPR